MTVGEGPGISKDVGLKYVGEDRGELNMIFHLDHMFLGQGAKGKFDPVDFDWNDIKRIFKEWYEAMGTSGWVSIFLDNHDFPRLVSRFGNDKEYRVESAKLLALMIFTLRGTPCVYQGSELGMSNVQFPSLADYRDIETLNYFKEFSKEGATEASFLPLAHELSRDNVRTPIHWDASKNSGFTKGIPWIKINPNYKEVNAEKVLADSDSIYFWYQKLLAFRKQNKTLVYGDWNVIKQSSEDLYVYERFDEDNHFYILLNHSDNAQNFELDLTGHKLEIHNIDIENLKQLKPWEARLYRKK